jgi:hypothetical protein
VVSDVPPALGVPDLGIDSFVAVSAEGSGGEGSGRRRVPRQARFEEGMEAMRSWSVVMPRTDWKARRFLGRFQEAVLAREALRN